MLIIRSCVAHQVVVSLSSRENNGVKQRILERIVSTSPYPVFAAYDVATTPESRHFSIPTVPLSNAANLKRFGSKVRNFNGKYTANPARLGTLRWFAESHFDYLWMLEDDTYAKNLTHLVKDYERSKADFVGAGSRGLPFWVRSGWRVGDPRHALKELDHSPFATAFWCVCRFSKRLARSLLDELRKQPHSSHHEVFLPFVVERRRLDWLPFGPNLTKHLALNAHTGTQHFMSLDQAVQATHVLLAHPIKHLTQQQAAATKKHKFSASGGCSNDTNIVAPCLSDDVCPIQSQSLESCRHLCHTRVGCNALVYNKYRHCYLKRHAHPDRPDPPQHQTISCALVV